MVMPLSSKAHTARAARHQKVADALADAGDEWSAVCYFYAAYHMIRAALLEDTIFDRLEWCQQKNRDLLPQDRHTMRHHGRKNTSNGREWGVNELVFLLYPNVVGAYERLHQASNDVRYHDGLRGSVADMQAVYRDFVDKFANGGLSSATTR